ncbi:PREDICTED: uncharacterized protein At4g04775-like [Camelina sativa]|uniref:Uncharacterized protein At4g04775-like n=1 Tax=Camelina sativa TaxID=90675 RepID=A0ABM0YWL0_CAMSA|nr:PREDICTED: uncharacterized protein At4g04775-like [Camelina sativa]
MKRWLLRRRGWIRGRVVRVPKICWCGEGIVTVISKSDSNPYRRYFCCGYAASNRLQNDDHTFKWVDEAMLNEIDSLVQKNCQLEDQLKEVRSEREAFEKLVFDNIGSKVEKEVYAKIEHAVSEAKASTKKVILGIVVFGMLIFGCKRLF